MAITIHLTAAIWALLAGCSQLYRQKGTRLHKFVGWSWMISMVIVAVSSFWITGFMELFWGLSPIHLLSIYILFSIGISLYSVRIGNIKRHKQYAVGAFYGVVGAGIGALLPGRLIYQSIFG